MTEKDQKDQEDLVQRLNDLKKQTAEMEGMKTVARLVISEAFGVPESMLEHFEKMCFSMGRHAQLIIDMEYDIKELSKYRSRERGESPSRYQ